MRLKPEVVAYRLKRARSAIGKKTEYKLGAGGFNPFASSPGKACDCSGFVAWCLPTSRAPMPKRPWWFETTRLVCFAAKPGAFVILKEPEPGCICVVPDFGGHEGHMGLVSTVLLGMPELVIDCSAGGWLRFGDAIREHDAEFFRRNPTVYVALKQDLV